MHATGNLIIPFPFHEPSYCLQLDTFHRREDLNKYSIFVTYIHIAFFSEKIINGIIVGKKCTISEFEAIFAFIIIGTEERFFV